MEQNIVIAGLGLIGGSLAKALSKYASCRVTGIDRDPDVLGAAAGCGAIAGQAADEDFKSADVLILCLYPQAEIDFLREHASRLRPGCIVTDACGVKAAVCPALSRIAAEHGLVFVGGHPMAGREKGGFRNSDADLFRGASLLLTPCGAPRDAVEILSGLARKLGFSRTVETTPEEHDRRIAFTSQLPHVLACAYVKSPQCPGHAGFSAGSYRDVSRVAAINEAMWAELFLANREALTEELDTMTENLAALRDALARNDETALRALLRESRSIKERLGEA